jgi:hypothetical protein
MNDIEKAVVSNSIQPTIEDLYEDEPDTPEKFTKQEAALIAATTPAPTTQIDGNEYVNPYSTGKHKSAEAEMQDRLLTIPRRPPNAPWGSLWLIRSGFIEQIALLNITKSEQRSLLRQWSDIQTLSEGDGNQNIVESLQDEFMLKIVSYKSRSDNPEKGIRERTAHITQKSIADQSITMPKSETQRSGFLNTILNRKVQQ